MNEKECSVFTDDLIIAFPEFAEVASRSSPNLGATKKTWAVAWKDLAAKECREALAQLLINGGIGYEDYRAPGPFIRRLVLTARNRGKPSEAEQADGKRKSRSEYKGSPMAAALNAAMKAKLDGKNEQECLAMIDAAFPPSNPYDQPRYKCQHCQDRGLVLVWRTDSDFSDISKLHRGHTYNVACFCEAGTLMNQPAKEKFRLPVYTPERYCKFANVDIETDRESLRRFLADKSKPAVWNPGEMELV
jgi:hypothetical protein